MRRSAFWSHLDGHAAPVVQIDLDTRQEILLKQEPVLGDFESDDYVTFWTWAEAPDGTRVPISVVHQKRNRAASPVPPLRLRRL